MNNRIDFRTLTMDRRQVLKGVAALGGSAMLLPTGAFAADAVPKKGGILRLAMPYNPASADPMTGRNLPDFNTLYAIFDGLIEFDFRTLELKPGLAKAWKFTDEKTLVLDLVEGVTFHDGTEFNADAVKINLERYQKDPRSNAKADLGALASVEVTSKTQVILHLSKPNAGLPTILTNRVGLMVSPKIIADKGPNIDRTPVGTGPFKFVEWQDNASFSLVRNEKYWKPGLPYLDGINIRIIGELNTEVRTVTADESDLALNLQPPQKAIADRASNLVVHSGPSLVYGTIFLNYSRPPFDDVRIRQALNYALDRDELNKVLALGLGEPTCAILPKEHWACDPATVNYYAHDPNKARKLLADAGHPNGIEIDAFGWPDQASMQRQELMVTQFQKSGIHIKLTPAAPQQAMQSFMLEKKGAMLFTPTGGYPDPSQQYEAMFAKDALRNAAKIELPGFRELMDATTAAPDREARKAAFVKLQRFVIEQALQVPQYIWPGISVGNPKVKNYADGLLDTPKFTEVWLEA